LTVAPVQVTATSLTGEAGAQAAKAASSGDKMSQATTTASAPRLTPQARQSGFDGSPPRRAADPQYGITIPNPKRTALKFAASIAGGHSRAQRRARKFRLQSFGTGGAVGR
jgi:hypothetical protein